MCPPSEDQQTEPVIAARQATAGQADRSPWGPDDQIGMLNLVTPESISSVLTEVMPTSCSTCRSTTSRGCPGGRVGAIRRSRSG